MTASIRGRFQVLYERFATLPCHPTVDVTAAIPVVFVCRTQQNLTEKVLIITQQQKYQ